MERVLQPSQSLPRTMTLQTTVKFKPKRRSEVRYKDIEKALPLATATDTPTPTPYVPGAFATPNPQPTTSVQENPPQPQLLLQVNGMPQIARLGKYQKTIS